MQSVTPTRSNSCFERRLPCAKERGGLLRVPRASITEVIQEVAKLRKARTRDEQADAVVSLTEKTVDIKVMGPIERLEKKVDKLDEKTDKLDEKMDKLDGKMTMNFYTTFAAILLVVALLPVELTARSPLWQLITKLFKL